MNPKKRKKPEAQSNQTVLRLAELGVPEEALPHILQALSRGLVLVYRSKRASPSDTSWTLCHKKTRLTEAMAILDYQPPACEPP